MKRYQMSESLPVGLLLALAGGILDSYTYLNRGQVFATAETGNLVLLGIHLAQGELGRVLSCLFPILAFALGVLTTEGLRRRLSSGRVHWRQPILAAECLVILVVSFLPQGDLDALGEGRKTEAQKAMFEMPLGALATYGVMGGEQLDHMIAELNGQG